MTRFLALFILLLSSTLQANIPEKKLQEFLKTVPGSKLSAPFVLARSMQSSSSFKQILAQLPLVKEPLLQSEAETETQIHAEAFYREDFKELANSSIPAYPYSLQYNVGAEKNFQSGTALKLDWTLQEQTLQFGSNPSMRHQESILSAELSQSLWKNSFGRETRSRKRAAKNQSKAIEYQILSEAESWALNIIGLYYKAWLEQQEAFSAQKNLNRKKRLLKSTRTKFRRGTAEKQDLLQIESSLNSAENSFLTSKEELIQTWQALIISLDLPRIALKVDPLKIPMSIPLLTQHPLCAQKKLPPENSKSLSSNFASQSAAAQLKSIKSSTRPDLSLFGKLASNGVDSSRGTAVGESFEAQNIEWLVGLRLQMPLGFKSNKAQIYKLAAEERKLKALSLLAKEEIEIEYLNQCSRLKQLNASMKLLKNTVKKQRQRSRLEEKEFRIGRASMFEVIQASDEAALAESTLNKLLAQIQLSIWKLKALSREIETEMKKHWEAKKS